MSKRPALKAYGALAVVGLAVLCTGVIALGFIIPDRLFNSDIGAVSFLVATVVMIACAIIANIYDVRGILAEEFG